MRLPNQSPPVMRHLSDAALIKTGIEPSDSIACSACHAACGALPWPANIACNIACDNTVCRL